jgi:hypothetical protein
MGVTALARKAAPRAATTGLTDEFDMKTLLYFIGSAQLLGLMR